MLRHHLAWQTEPPSILEELFQDCRTSADIRDLRDAAGRHELVGVYSKLRDGKELIVIGRLKPNTFHERGLSERPYVDADFFLVRRTIEGAPLYSLSFSPQGYSLYETGLLPDYITDYHVVKIQEQSVKDIIDRARRAGFLEYE